MSYRICHIILGTYNHAITATLLCLAVDMDLNNSTPYFGPPKFHEMIDAMDFDKFKSKKGENKNKKIKKSTINDSF